MPHLKRLSGPVSKPSLSRVSTSTPRQYTEAAAGTTVAPGSRTRLRTASNSLSQLEPSRPGGGRGVKCVDRCGKSGKFSG